MLDPPVLFTPPPAGWRPARTALGAGAAAIALAALGWAGAPLAQTPTVLQGGPPAQVIPTAPEPGIPLITINPGTANPFAGLGGGLGPGGDGSDPGGGSGGGGNVGSSNALTTMLGTSWGAQAVDAAQSLGVNPSALAATCVAETSTCRNVTNPHGATGPFQMFGPAFQDGLHTALQANPALASQIVQGAGGINDPFTQSVAASGYLMQANQALQAHNIPNPTVTDARAYYQFGPTYGVQVAQADPSTPISAIVPSGWLASNGLTSQTTVGQWRSAIANRVGSAAGQSVLGS